MIKQLALCVLRKGVGSMDYVHSMMIVMYDRDEDQVPPVRQNVQEAPCPKQLKISAVSIRSVLQVQEDLENYVLTQNFCYLAAVMLVISGMTHMTIAPGHLENRHIDIF